MPFYPALCFGAALGACGLTALAPITVAETSGSSGRRESGAPSGSVSDASPALVPRSVLFGNPVKEAPSLCPNGTRLAYLAPDDQGVLQVWVSTPEGNDALALTRDPHRGVGFYLWAENDRQILYTQDSDGDENYHVYAADLESKIVRDLTPFQGVRAQNLLTSPARPNELLVGLNLRERDAFDMYRIDLETGAVRLDTENPGDVLSWTTDPDFEIRAATAFDPETAATILRVRDRTDAPWRDLVAWPFEAGTMYGQVNGGTIVAGFAPDGRSLYVASALRSATQRLERLDASTGATLEILAEDPKADVAARSLSQTDLRPAAMVNPATHALEAVAFEYGQVAWRFLDPAVRADFELLSRDYPGFLQVVSRTRDDAGWIVLQFVDDGPQTYLLFDRRTKAAKLLFQDRPDLARYRLARTRFVTIQARDGLTLPAYLTLPPDGPGKNLPLMLYPHAPPDRTRGQRSARQDRELGQDRGGDAGRRDSGDLPGLSRRRPWVREAGEQPRLLGAGGGVPGEAPGRKSGALGERPRGDRGGEVGRGRRIFTTKSAPVPGAPTTRGGASRNRPSFDQSWPRPD